MYFVYLCLCVYLVNREQKREKEREKDRCQNKDSRIWLKDKNQTGIDKREMAKGDIYGESEKGDSERKKQECWMGLESLSED